MTIQTNVTLGKADGIGFWERRRRVKLQRQMRAREESEAIFGDGGEKAEPHDRERVLDVLTPVGKVAFYATVINAFLCATSLSAAVMLGGYEGSLYLSEGLGVAGAFFFIFTLCSACFVQRRN